MFPLSSIPSAGRPMDRSNLLTQSAKEALILGSINRVVRVSYRFLIVQGMRVTRVSTVGFQGQYWIPRISTRLIAGLLNGHQLIRGITYDHTNKNLVCQINDGSQQWWPLLSILGNQSFPNLDW